MKKLHLILFLTFLSLTTLAQMPEEIKWKHLQKDYNTDSSELVLSLNNKLLQGKYKIPFDEGGFALYNIKKGIITGEAFWYSQGGTMECKLYYKNGVRNGLKENYDKQGKVWLRQHYKDGKKNGISEMLSDGKLISKSEYRTDKKHGLSQTFSGENVITETHYENDLKHGTSKNYSLDGKLTIEANYKNDKRDGTYRVYNNGQLMTETNYKDDLQNGLSTTYALGKKNMDAEFLNGKRHGISHMYKPDGSVLFTHYYLDGEKVTEAIYNQAQKK
ncbi:toxin-antitoxin system YwqK family antitoxin [Pedobacter xixiisoli]|uniref:Antitoxin component YwqK of the YwqJK toxin-antitoxin module n=1 Tax=Pedobacter xixiisoli TaxID=1476464 RepID=A0A286A8Z6_9SPHI|nr:toxin-antitoxin system YwqK family antitoxin [Pedobacter xixiisoli]SOD18388.1 Antitoxin component YwqK of the YwqJK toxin-antitoxin module [Pedobacter xixiisoli]